MPSARLNRLFRASGKCLDVAIDHGVFNESSFLDGLEDIETVVARLVAAGPDAIQMNLGQADVLQRIAGPDKPALVARLDASNVYNRPAQAELFDVLVRDDDPVLAAVRLDAACVVCNLLLVDGRPELHRDTIENAARLRELCDEYAMPLMIEPLLFTADLWGHGEARRLVALVRQARELGADIVKADPTEDPNEFHRVVEAARCPVLVRGGGKEPLETVLRKAHALLQQGARGLVFGRNIFQQPDPAATVRMLLRMIHDGASPEDVLRG